MTIEYLLCTFDSCTFDFRQYINFKRNPMRKIFWFLVVAVLAFSFAACSDDDKKDDKTIAEKIAGVYTGTFTVTQEDGTPLGDPMENQKVYITATGEQTVDLELKDFKFGVVPVGNLKVANVQVKENGDVNGNAQDVPIMNGLIKAELTLAGKVKDNKADLTINVEAPLTPGGDPIVMHVTFAGKL